MGAATSDQDARVASEKLRFVVESELPSPIARGFAKLRAAHDAAAGPIAANLLGDVLRHCAHVLIAEHVARGPSAEIRQRVVADLRKPQSHGQLLGLALALASGLEGGDPLRPAARLAAQLLDRITREHLDAAVTLRNSVVKKGEVDGGGELKQAVIAIVRQLLFLRELPIVVVTSSKVRAGANVIEVKYLVGTDDGAEGRVETDLALVVGHVYMVDPISRTALDLHPLYVVPSGAARVAWLARAGSPPEYETGDGETEKRKDLVEDVAEFVESRQRGAEGRRMTMAARFLSLRGGGQDVARRRLAAGDVIDGRYRIVQLIGEGGMAHVYEVHDVRDGDRALALKVLPYEYIRDRTMLTRFRREAEETSQLDHPNVMPCLRFGEDLGDNFLVMPLAEGWPLADGGRALDASQLARPIGIDEVIAIGKQVAEGLHYVHDKAIVHRDLKPRNLLLDRDHRVRLSDFGVARTADAMTLTMTGLGVGTPEYMAPEQIDGAPPEPSADLYSLGAVLYELLVGEPPYTGKSPLAIMQAVATRAIPDPRARREDTPVELALLVRRLLAKDPAKRPRSARQVYRLLCGEAAIEDEPDAGELAPLVIASPPQPAPSWALEDVAATDALIDGRYRLGRKLGESGLAETFEAENIQTAHRVVIKLFRGLVRDVEQRKRFAKIARDAARLHHGSLAEVFDVGIDGDSTLYVVSRFVEGTQLFKLVDEHGPLEPVRACGLVAQLADGLAAAHRVGLIHRDVKPSSIMVESKPFERAVLFDFGVDQMIYAPREMASTATGGFAGSPAFVAPEQARDGTLKAPSIDVYALASVLYFMLTGRPPFDGSGVMAILSDLATTMPSPPSRWKPGIPASVDAVVLAALVKDPDARPTMEQFAKQLRELPPVTPTVSPKVAPRTLRAPLIVGGAAAVSLVVGLLVLRPWSDGQRRPVLPDAAVELKVVPGEIAIRTPASTLSQRAASNAWSAIIEAVTAGDNEDALARLHEFEAEYGASKETTELAAQLDKLPVPIRGSMKHKSRKTPAAAVDEPQLEGGGTRDDIVTLSRFGFFSVTANAKTTIVIDGDEIGPTPLVRKPLRPGPHKVKAIGPNLKVKEFDITIFGAKDTDWGTITW